jgi:hypothetical protein
MSGTITATRIDANEDPWRSELTDEQRRELLAWVEAQRVRDPRRVVSIEYLVVDAPLIYVEHYLRDENDRVVAHPDHDDLVIPRVGGDYAVRTPLPHWWVPGATTDAEPR